MNGNLPWYSVADLCSGCSFAVRLTIGTTWVNGPWHTPGNYTIDHVLSLDVPDSGSASLKLQVFSNEQPNPREIDVSSQTGQTAYTTVQNLASPDRYGLATCGENPIYHACVGFDVRVIRVGKSNTLLMTPNDWSTLSNGTVDGKPTGYHRYVGEQRFVFALLNVTDGTGNLVSYDLEARETNGRYTDASPSALHACHAGDTPVPGRFGYALTLSGSGSYVEACGTNPSATLNVLTRSMTVAFWIRADADCAGGLELGVVVPIRRRPRPAELRGP